MKLKYPKSVAAVQAHQKSQWTIGDALLEECGPPSKQGKNDGSYAKLVEAASEIARECGDVEMYSLAYLARMREVSYAFKDRTARRAVPWSVHQEAGDPKTLEVIVEKAEGKTVTRDQVRTAKQKDRQEIPVVVMPPPPISNKPKAPEEPNLLILEGDLDVRSMKAMVLAEEYEKILGDYASSLHHTAIDVLVEHALGASNMWRAIADKLRASRQEKRSHLQVVS